VIAGTVPPILAFVVSRCNAAADIVPPNRRRRGVELEWLELDEVSGRSLALTRNTEAHCRLAVDVGEDKAPRIKMEMRQSGQRATVVRVQTRTEAEDRITLHFIHMEAGCLESSRCRRTEEVGHRRLLSRAKVEHASARRVPRRMTGQVDVYVVLEGQIGPEDIEDIDLSRR